MYSWKYHRKHIFYLLLTFSHIFLVAKLIYNIIHSSIQKHKQNPEKKIIKSGQIERRRNRERWLSSTRGCDRRGASQDRDRREGESTIGAVLRTIAIDGSRDCDRRFARSQWSRRSKLWTISASSTFLVAWSVMSKGSLLSLLSFSLSLSRSLSHLRVTRKWFEGKMKA